MRESFDSWHNEKAERQICIEKTHFPFMGADHSVQPGKNGGDPLKVFLKRTFPTPRI